MDCIVPGHSVRPFCAAISCLSRVGKEVFFEFDPIDGLTLRSLNDSKSAFCSFHYEPSYFLRCTLECFTGHRQKRRKTSRDAAGRGSSSSDRRRRRGSGGNEDEEEDDDDRWCVRISIKALAAVLRPRKNVSSLQVVTTGDFLSFEFCMQRPNGLVVRVVHQVGVASANSVAAVSTTTGSSEMVVQPTILMPMLEPLRRAAEIALLVNESRKLVSSATVAHDDFSTDAVSSLGRHASLKTETSIRYDELIRLDYISHPDEGTTQEGNNAVPPPDDLEDQVVLVFSLKEFKAMLSYCAHSHVDMELDVTLFFYWGGKPLVVEAKGEGFSTQLVLATLDHKLLSGMWSSAGGGGGGQ